jgi:hypothetical protein
MLQEKGKEEAVFRYIKKGDKKKEAHPFSVSTYSTESPPPPLVIFIIRTARIRR